MKKFLSSFFRHKTNFLVAGVIAVGLIFALSIFASGNLITPKSCQNQLGDNKSQELALGMKKMGWKDPSTYTCKVDFSNYHYGAIHGGYLAPEFKNVITKDGIDPAKFRAFINGGSVSAGLFTTTAQQNLSAKSYNDWKSGNHFVAIQLDQPSELNGDSYLDGSVVAVNQNHRIPLPKGQIIILFLDPNTKAVNVNGNIVPDCGNVRIAQIFPQAKQEVGKLRIVKFEDKNGNGKEDQGEPRMKNVTFRVPDIGTFQTDNNGEIVIGNLSPDKYEVIEKKGDKDLQDFKPTTSDDQKVDVKKNDTAVVKFGNQKNAGKLRIVKFDDKNGNGKDDQGEDGIQGIHFIVKDDKGKQIDEGKTDKDGVLVIGGLKGGDYKVVEDLTKDQNAKYKSTTDTTQKVKVKELDTAVVKFGNQRTNVRIKIVKFKDDNGNGKEDANEHGLQGFKFLVQRESTGNDKIAPIVGTITTDKDGKASIDNLQPGNYFATEQPTKDQSATFTATTPIRQGGQAKNGDTLTLTFGNKKNVTVTQTGSLQVVKFNDKNNDGTQDTDEPPVAGVSFVITGPNGFNQTHITDDSGTISLTGLALGAYTATETVPSGASVTTQNPQNITVVADQTGTMTFGDHYVCVSPSPSVTPSPTATPSEVCSPGPSPSPTPKTPPKTVTQTFGSLPKTGQAGVVAILTFLVASALYYGGRYYRRRTK